MAKIIKILTQFKKKTIKWIKLAGYASMALLKLKLGDFLFNDPCLGYILKFQLMAPSRYLFRFVLENTKVVDGQPTKH